MLTVSTQSPTPTPSLRGSVCEHYCTSVCVCGLRQHPNALPGPIFECVCVCAAVCGGGASCCRPEAGPCGFDLSQASYGFN